MKTKIEKPFVLLMIIFTILSLGAYFAFFSLIGGWHKEGGEFYNAIMYSSLVGLFFPTIFFFIFWEAAFIFLAAFTMVGGLAISVSPYVHGHLVPFFIVCLVTFGAAMVQVEDIVKSRYLSERFVYLFLVVNFFLIVTAGMLPSFFP